jgi:hypothetical protein
MTSSDEDEEKVTRPAGDMVLHITKEELYEQILMVKHPIIHCEDKLEKAYRYIDIVNSTNEEDEQRGRLL